MSFSRHCLVAKTHSHHRLITKTHSHHRLVAGTFSRWYEFLVRSKINQRVFSSLEDRLTIARGCRRTVYIILHAILYNMQFILIHIYRQVQSYYTTCNLYVYAFIHIYKRLIKRTYKLYYMQCIYIYICIYTHT